MDPIETVSWKKVKLGEHVDLLTGFPFKSSRYSDDKNSIKLLRGDNVAQGHLRWEGVKRWTLSDSDDFTKYWLEKDDVILAMDRPWIEAGLKNAWVKEGDVPCLLVQRVTRMRGAKGLLTNFLRYIIVDQSFTDYIKPIVTGVSIPHISASQIQGYTFQLPPIEVQSKIATILSAYDDLIENNTRRIKILEEMAQALYREWFVKFRFPGHEKVKKVESELGMVPEGWEIEKVNYILKRLKAGTVYTANDVYESGLVPVIDQSRDIFLGFHNNNPDHFATPEKPIVIFGDHTCKMKMMVEPFSVGPNVVPFISQNEVPLIYLYFLVRNLVETKEYKRHWTELKNKKVVFATKDYTKKFANSMTSLFEHIDLLTREKANLHRTRDLLLPKLISGEVDVSGLDITTGEAT